MVSVGKHVGLVGKVCAAGVDQINAGQVVFEGDLLGSKVLFDGDGEVASALDCGVVSDEHAFSSVNATDAGDDSGGGCAIAVHTVGGECAELEERRARVEAAVDSLAGEEFAARFVAIHSFGSTALHGFGHARAVVSHDRVHRGAVLLVFVVFEVYLRENQFQDGIMVPGQAG